MSEFLCKSVCMHTSTRRKNFNVHKQFWFPCSAASCVSNCQKVSQRYTYLSHSHFIFQWPKAWAVVLHQVLCKTQKIQQPFVDDSMGVTQIKQWYSSFKDGCLSVESDQDLAGSQNATIIKKVQLWSWRTIIWQFK